MNARGRLSWDEFCALLAQFFSPSSTPLSPTAQPLTLVFTQPWKKWTQNHSRGSLSLASGALPLLRSAGSPHRLRPTPAALNHPSRSSLAVRNPCRRRRPPALDFTVSLLWATTSSPAWMALSQSPIPTGSTATSSADWISGSALINNAAQNQRADEHHQDSTMGGSRRATSATWSSSAVTTPSTCTG